MVAAEHERRPSAARRSGDELRHLVAERKDLVQEARPLVARLGRLRDRRDDVPEVDRLNAERLLQMLLQSRVPDRRRTHVDATASRPEVERRADQGDLPVPRLQAHAGKANVRPWTSRMGRSRYRFASSSWTTTATSSRRSGP